MAQVTITEYHRLDAKTIDTDFSQFWRMRSSRPRCWQISVSSERPLPGLRRAAFLLCPKMGGGREEERG